MSADLNHQQPIVVTDAELQILQRIDALLDEQSVNGGPACNDAVMLVGPSGGAIELPASVRELLRQAVHHLAQDDAVSVVPISKELTTQQAADVLNVSRPYLIELLERGDLPFHKVGTHRRLRLNDVLAYRTQRDQERREGLRRLTRKSQRLGLYGSRVKT